MTDLFVAVLAAARETVTITTPYFAPDPPLIGAAVLFGAGWGLVGLCPGSAFSALGLGGAPVLFIMTSVVAGMLAFEWLWTPLQNRASA